MSVHALIRHAPTGTARLQNARVLRSLGPSCTLHPSAPVREARVAAGCLLQPQPGDSVLLLVAEQGPAWILCVLEQAAARWCLRLPGGSEWQCDEQGLSLRTGRLRLAAEHALELQGADIAMRSVRCQLRTSSLQLHAARVQAALGTLRARGREWMLRLGSSIAEFGDSVRRVRGMDETQAAQQRVRVERRLHIEARDASIVAQHHVRVDAPHIDLG